MIIWHGWGIAIIFIVMLALVTIQVVVDGLFGTGTYSANSALYAPIGLIIAAFLTKLLDERLEQKYPSQVLQDKETGQEVVLRRKHSLFFIELKYWVWIMGVLAILSLTVSFFRSLGS